MIIGSIKLGVVLEVNFLLQVTSSLPLFFFYAIRININIKKLIITYLYIMSNQLN